MRSLLCCSNNTMNRSAISNSVRWHTPQLRRTNPLCRCRHLVFHASTMLVLPLPLSHTSCSVPAKKDWYTRKPSVLTGRGQNVSGTSSHNHSRVSVSRLPTANPTTIPTKVETATQSHNDGDLRIQISSICNQSPSGGSMVGKPTRSMRSAFFFATLEPCPD